MKVTNRELRRRIRKILKESENLDNDVKALKDSAVSYVEKGVIYIHNYNLYKYPVLLFLLIKLVFFLNNYNFLIIII